MTSQIHDLLPNPDQEAWQYHMKINYLVNHDCNSLSTIIFYLSVCVCEREIEILFNLIYIYIYYQHFKSLPMGDELLTQISPKDFTWFRMLKLKWMWLSAGYVCKFSTFLLCSNFAFENKCKWDWNMWSFLTCRSNST